MSVVIETTLGDITVDLFLELRPITCLNFLKLCKMKYYNFNLFHSIRSGFIAQTGDPTGEGSGGESIWGLLNGPEKRFFSGEKMPKIRHTDAGLLSMVCTGEMMVGSQFFFTLGPDLDSLDGVHCVIGEVTEGHEILRKLNDVICDETHRPYQDVRITHTVVLEDPFSDPPGLRAPSRSPSPSAERLKGGRIAPDEELDEAQGKTSAEIQEMIEEKEAKARATILEIVGDLPDADIAPPENVLFVCKLNPVTTDEDLEIIFSRFGKIVSCEVIRDKKTGDSLQYAFIEFDDKKSCEDAYFKMDNVLIDDRRIHVDFSQSVSKMRWLGKGRGVQHFNDDGSKVSDVKRDRSRRSRSKEHHNEKHHYNRDKYTDTRRNDDRTDRNVTNKGSHKERSRSRPRTEYQINSKDYFDSRERQSSKKNEEYTNRDKRRERSSSQSKSSNHKTEKSNASDKKERSRHRYEEEHGTDDQSEKRSQEKLHRNDQSESKRDNKPRSSRHHDDETRNEDRQSNRDDERKTRHEDQHRSRVESKRVFDEKDIGKYNNRSSKKYEDKLGDETEHKQRKRREELSLSGKESRKNTEEHKLRQRNERQSEIDNEILERGHKTISDNYYKDKTNSKSDENKKHDMKDKNRDDGEKNSHHSTSRNKYDHRPNDTVKEHEYINKEITNYNEKISSRNKDQEVNRYEERFDTNNTRHEKRDRSRNENDDDDLEHKKKHQQRDAYEGRKDGSSKKHKDSDSRTHCHGRESNVRRERKERDKSGRSQADGCNQKQKKAIESDSHTEKSDLEQTEKETSQRTEKEKRKKRDVKRKDLKKKVINKKKSLNTKENKKRKRKASTSSDSDSDSSDSSSSTDSSSSSSSDCKRRSKKRRKYSSSSSSSSSTSSSSESSSTSSSSSDSDAKKKKIKKKKTMKSKRK